MRCVAFQFSGASIIPWTVDRDSIVIGVQCTGGKTLVSGAPGLQVASFVTPVGSTQALEGFPVYAYCDTVNSATISQPNKVPISAGKTIYVACNVNCSAMLWLDDPEPVS